MPQFPTEDDTSSLERARERLYKPIDIPAVRRPLTASDKGEVPHAWEESGVRQALRKLPLGTFAEGPRHVQLAGVFFKAAIIFFVLAFIIAGYFFLSGGNAVSVDKVVVDIQSPTTIAGGDTVPLLLTITNKNSAAIQNVTVEIDFPSGTRNATNMLLAYPHYSENIGTLASGASVTRSVKAVLFGGVGQTLALPVSVSYGTTGSNAVFVKKSSYTLAVSTTPLSVSIDTLSEAISGQPFTITLTVRSNATVPLNNVVLTGAPPFGFSLVSSSIPSNNLSFSLGTMSPGSSKVVSLVGTLLGQNNEQRVFHFTVGTAKSASDQTLAVSYMTQDATVAIAAPFISTTLALNGNTADNVVVTPGSSQHVTVSYTNTLATSIQNATVSIGLSGSAIDYNSIQTTSGFYRSSDHTVVFSQDTDPSLITLAPGASGVGAFTFSTKAAGTPAPTIIFTISVSGTRVGQTNVPEQVSSSATKTARVATAVAFSAVSMHASGPLSNSGPIPPRADQATTYTIQWNAQNGGNAVADGTVSTVLPSYVSYTGLTAGAGTFSYNDVSHTVSWNTGDIAQGASVQGAFQVSLTPSTSQKGNPPLLTGVASFSGYDRFAGVQVKASADPVSTETRGDPGYSSANALVQ